MVELKNERVLRKLVNCYKLDIAQTYPLENVKNMKEAWTIKTGMYNDFLSDYDKKLKAQQEAAEIEVNNMIEVLKKEVKRIDELTPEELQKRLTDRHAQDMKEKRAKIESSKRLVEESHKAIADEMNKMKEKAKAELKSTKEAVEFWNNPKK